MNNKFLAFMLFLSSIILTSCGGSSDSNPTTSTMGIPTQSVSVPDNLKN